MKIVYNENKNFILKLDKNDFIFVRFENEKVLSDYKYFNVINYNKFKGFVNKRSARLLTYSTIDPEIIIPIIKNYIRKQKLRKLLS